MLDKEAGFQRGRYLAYVTKLISLGIAPTKAQVSPMSISVLIDAALSRAAWEEDAEMMCFRPLPSGSL